MLDYSKLHGKKLLILGGTPDECLVVETAKRLGIYTIVTDYNANWDLSPAKKIADEAWDISWSDLDSLYRKAKEEKIDGVMAGYSERRIQQAIELSNSLGMPFYVDNQEVLSKTFDKKQFKNICKENNVPVTKDYSRGNSDYEKWVAEISFPVVVKPVDDGGSRGIRTSYNKEDLRDAIEYALSFSHSHDVIVEELIKNAQEIVVYYTIADGEAILSAMCDKYERKISEGFNSLPDVYLYPSVHLDEFLQKHNADVIKTLKKMGMKNGSANLQGFYADGRFLFFEMDYRPGGTNTFIFTEHFNGENYLKMLIHYSLTGECDKEELLKADPMFCGKRACEFTLIANNGIIASQTGKEVVDSWSNVLYSCFYHHIGEKIVVNGSQTPKTYRAYFVGESIEDIKTTIQRIQNTVLVFDENGKNMLFRPFDIDRLNGM